MTSKYMAAYAAYIIGMIGLATVAVAWYKHVEQIGMNELRERMRPAPDATEDTDTPDG